MEVGLNGKLLVIMNVLLIKMEPGPNLKPEPAPIQNQNMMGNV